jgi:hypothetical protein
MLLAQVPPALTAITAIWFISSGRWGLVGIWVEPSVIGWNTGFADLAYVTATADCLTQNLALETCDPYGRPFTPYSIVPGSFLALLGMGLQQTGALGVLLALTWVMLIGIFSTWIAARWKGTAIAFTVALLALTITAIAPPSLLAIERGTIDIAITAVAAMGLLLFVRQPTKPRSITQLLRQVVGAVLLFFVAIVKYFAVGVFAAFTAPRRWMLVPLISAAAAAIFLLLNFSDLLIAREVSKSDLPSTTRILFSSTTGLVTWLTEDPYAFFPAEGQSINMTGLRFIGALIVVAWVALFLTINARTRFTRSIPQSSWPLIAGGGFILVVPYFLGDSNDYRLIGLVLPLAGILIWLATSLGSKFLWLPVVLIVVTMLTGSSMIANEYGFIIPKNILIIGDGALAGVIGFIIAIWISAWLPRSRTRRVLSHEITEGSKSH